MEFKRLCIQNFKSIEALMYEPKNKVLAITGPNGKGKTSFKEALFAAFTGIFPDNAISEGKIACTVELTLPDSTVITRVVQKEDPNYTMVNGKKVTAKSVNELIESRTGINRDTFKIISSGENIEKLSSSELGTLMLEAIPEKLNYNKLLKYAGTVPAEVLDEFVKLFPAMPEEFTMDKVNIAYDSAFEQRKFLRKVLSSYQAKVDTFMLDEPERKLADIEKELEEIVKKEAAQASKKRILELYESAVKSREKAEDALKSLIVQRDAIKATRPLESGLKKIEADLEAANKSLIEAKAVVTTLIESNTIFKNTLLNIDKTVCPISERLVCTTDKTMVKEELNEIISSNEEGIKIQNDVIDKKTKEIAAITAQKREYEANAKEYNRRIMLDAQIEAATKSLPEVPPQPDVGRNEDFSAQKAFLKSEQDAAKQWAQHLLDLEHVENTKKQVSVIDYICKLLEPKGVVISNIMDYYLSVFQAVFNDRAAKLKSGFEIKFAPINGVSYQIKTSPTGPYKNFGSLSSGEKQLVSFLLVDMFNSLSQQRSLFLDDVDKLDSESFQQLIQLIMTPALSASYDIIVIAGVDHQDIIDTLDKYSGDIDRI